MQQRRLLPLVGLLLFLSACGGSEVTTTACDKAYWDGTVGTCLPAGWHVVDRSTLDERGVPAEVVVAFQSDAPYAGQFATVTVTREVLVQELPSSEYSDASVESVKGLPSFDEIDRRTVTVDGEDVAFYVFSAQPRPEEPEARFYQVSAVEGNTGYTFTAATPVATEAELEDQVSLILSNVTFKAPEGEQQQ